MVGLTAVLKVAPWVAYLESWTVAWKAGHSVAPRDGSKAESTAEKKAVY
jgi:hypothetical protein